MTEVESLPDIEPEEAARALWYAIVSRLFYAPPDQALLDGLATVGEQGVVGLADDRAAVQIGRGLVMVEPAAFDQHHASAARQQPSRRVWLNSLQ